MKSVKESRRLWNGGRKSVFGKQLGRRVRGGVKAINNFKIAAGDYKKLWGEERGRNSVLYFCGVSVKHYWLNH